MLHDDLLCLFSSHLFTSISPSSSSVSTSKSSMLKVLGGEVRVVSMSCVAASRDEKITSGSFDLFYLHSYPW